MRRNATAAGARGCGPVRKMRGKVEKSRLTFRPSAPMVEADQPFEKRICADLYFDVQQQL
jgi:hypothetical protein